MQRVDRASFSTGCLSLFVRDARIEIESDSGCNDDQLHIDGEVTLRLQMPTYIRGVWVKLMAYNKLVLTNRNGRSIGISADLLRGAEHHHLDGLHEVFVGFGEGDNDEGNFIELPAGKHTWQFSFPVPATAPASYRDEHTAISYRLSAVLDSLMVDTPDSRLRLNHTVIRKKVVDAREHAAKLNLNSVVLRPDHAINSAAGDGRKQMDALGIVGRVVQRALRRRTPKLCITGAGRSDAPHAAAIFQFVDQQKMYRVKCQLCDCFAAEKVTMFAELYAELSYRSHANIPFEDAATRICSSDKKYFGLPYGEVMKNSHGESRCISLWKHCKPQRVNEGKVECAIDIPIKIDTVPRNQMLHESSSALLDHTVRQGSILHYSMEMPLFRYRIMLQVAVLKADQTFLCPAVRGEVHILPSKEFLPEQCLEHASALRLEPSPPQTERASSFFRRRAHAVSGTTTSPNSLNSSGSPSEEIMHPSPVGPLYSAVNHSSADNDICETPRRPNSANLAQSHFVPNPPPHAANVRTPAARPTNAKIVMRVDAEPLAKGPAAVVIDRSERTRDPVSTPQHFAEMYHIGNATVLDGSPICAVINTPGPAIAPHEERHNEDPIQQLTFGNTPRITAVGDHSPTEVQENYGSARTDGPIVGELTASRADVAELSDRSNEHIEEAPTGPVVSREERQIVGRCGIMNANNEVAEFHHLPQQFLPQADAAYFASISRSNFNSSILIDQTQGMAPLLVQ